MMFTVHCLMAGIILFFGSSSLINSFTRTSTNTKLNACIDDETGVKPKCTIIIVKTRSKVPFEF